MKRLLVLLLVLSLLLTVTGCSEAETASSNGPVVINLPKDNSVNGYRLKPAETENSQGEIVDANNVKVESQVADTDPTEAPKIIYCANVESMYFHKSDCSSVKKMKEENKFYLRDRAQLIADGYTPCKQCKP